jgi:small redox-active disulfide protein 2
MDKKESKKGFWSTLFAPKKKSCCCNDMIVDDDVKPVQSCGCSGEPAESNETSCCATAPGTKASEVLILGPGCAKCKETYKVVERVIDDYHLAVKLSKIEDIAEIMSYNIMTTPALVIDGTVKIKGHVPTAEEVKKALGI